MRLEGLPMKNVTKIISPAKVNLVLAVGANHYALVGAARHAFYASF